MISSFFQRLEQQGVGYLLISGQATILYGAATFSEDVDIWLEPTDDNVARLISALRSEGARELRELKRNGQLMAERLAV